MTLSLEIREDDLSGKATRELLTLHLRGMHATSPLGHVFALDLSGLQGPDVTVWSAWTGETICGIGALNQIDRELGELKSMRTHPDHLRKGVGAAILEHIINEASRRGLRKLSLETGSSPPFQPAVELYLKRGFVPGEPFGDYQKSNFNQFLHLAIAGQVAN